MVIDDGDDLLLEILFRLPVKQLVRFKSVSKRWLSLISSPHFYYRLARRNYGFLVIGPGNLLPYVSKIHVVSLKGNPLVAPLPPFEDIDPRKGMWSILQSCNGLLLCEFYKNHSENYCILNPTTMQYFMLPPLIEMPRSCLWNRVISLAFDPLKSPYYKVVSVLRIYKDDSMSRVHYYQIEIYSNEFGIWRNSGDPFTIPNTNMFYNDGVFSNGAIHWIGQDGHWVYFVVEDERLVIMSPLPFTVPRCKREFRYFGASFGHLHLIDIDDSQTTQFKVYELEKDCSNWFLKFNVDLDPIVETRPDDYFPISILSIVREEDDDESSLLLHIPGVIISYKFKDRSFKKLHDLLPCSCNDNDDGGVGLLGERCNIKVYQYIESIACVRTCN